MDKFLYLIRCYVEAGFEWCRRGIWEHTRVVRLVTLLREWPLSTEIERPNLTNGLRFHVVDVWVDEIEGARRKEETDPENMPLASLLAPVKKMKQLTKDKAIRTRVEEALGDERLKEWKGEGATELAEAEE